MSFQSIHTAKVVWSTKPKMENEAIMKTASKWIEITPFVRHNKFAFLYFFSLPIGVSNPFHHIILINLCAEEEEEEDIVNYDGIGMNGSNNIKNQSTSDGRLGVRIALLCIPAKQ